MITVALVKPRYNAPYNWRLVDPTTYWASKHVVDGLVVYHTHMGTTKCVLEL